MTNIKVIEKNGKKPGSTAVILVGVHGNEKFGVKVIEEYIKDLSLDKGKIYFIYANLEAIKQDKRFIEKDLNRCFLKNQPQDILESLEGRTAKEIMEYLDKSDYMLDIHATNGPNSIPFIICEKQNFKFVKSFPFEIVCFGFDNVHPGSSDYYMNLQNKTGICIECGKYNDINNFEIAKKSIDIFLKKAGLIGGDVNEYKNQKHIKIKSIYRNKYGKFIKSREFDDFEFIKEKLLVGFDGEKEIYVDKNTILLFVRDREELDEECFLILKNTNA